MTTRRLPRATPAGSSFCGPTDGFNYPAICPNYTTEMNAGHLNSVGKVRLAKAFWVLMAQVAGWTP